MCPSFSLGHAQRPSTRTTRRRRTRRIRSSIRWYCLWRRRGRQGGPSSFRKHVSEKPSPPQQILCVLETRFERLQKSGTFDSVDRNRFSDDSKVLIDALGVCHRIQKTPIPFVYAVYLRRILVMYLATLPIALVEKMGWNSLWILALVGYALLGLEQIGVEIENPFEEGANDLHLFGIATSIEKDVAALSP
ncbi:MAG: bestrophin [Deltaproteobacteria bacterium]|nr:bestrophin [Deltaproteobacteria bacterium]